MRLIVLAALAGCTGASQQVDDRPITTAPTHQYEPPIQTIEEVLWCGGAFTDVCHERSGDCLTHSSGCAPHRFFACFTYTQAVTGRRDRMCFKTMDVCSRIQRASASVSDISNAGPCFVYRSSETAIARHEQSSPLRMEGDVPVVMVDHRFYCFTARPTRLCMSDAVRCATYRDRIAPGEPCAAEDAVACFRTRDVTTGRLDAMCFSTMAQCHQGRQAFASPDIAMLDSMCVVMRYRP